MTMVLGVCWALDQDWRTVQVLVDITVGLSWVWTGFETRTAAGSQTTHGVASFTILSQSTLMIPFQRTHFNRSLWYRQDKCRATISPRMFLSSQLLTLRIEVLPMN